jgi:hypothetical protein
MRRHRTLITLMAVAAVMAMALPAAMAGHTGNGKPAEGDNFRANLRPVPHHPQADGGSHVTGSAGVTRTDEAVRVYVEVDGVTAGVPHAQHIHGVGLARCPAAEKRDERVEDGLIDTVEGIEDYGAVQTALTTEGDASPGSGLAVDRFPTTDDGSYTYDRTFTIGEDISEDVADNLENHSIVVHGADVNGNGELDFDSGTSSLTEDLPLEATVPVACGEIQTR